MRQNKTAVKEPVLPIQIPKSYGWYRCPDIEISNHGLKKAKNVQAPSLVVSHMSLVLFSNQLPLWSFLRKVKNYNSI